MSGEEGKPVTCLVIGAGSRGYGYSCYAKAFPAEFEIVGVAEPREFFRKRIQKEFHVPDDFAFKDWRDAVEREKFADCVIIATPDREHKGPAVAFANKGYHLLLEKPMAVTEEDCREIVTTCKKNNTLLAVCHVLRYAPWARKLKEIIDSGEIGNVVSIQHTEPPEGAGDRCLDCSIERDCPYSAKRIYLAPAKEGHRGWPLSVIAEVPDIESVTDALKTGPYGRCVYECDNDVMSHQVTNFQFDNGATASLTMVAFSSKLCEREVMVYGTKGEITCDAGLKNISVYSFLTQSSRQVSCHSKMGRVLRGHGGADYHLMRSFVTALRSGSHDLIQTGADDTLASHLLVFAAEKARKENRVVEIVDGTF